MRKLSQLDVNEVSLVPRGANKKKFLVLKSDEGGTMPNVKQDIRKLVAEVSDEKLAPVDKVLKTLRIKKEGVGSDLAPKPGSAVNKNPDNLPGQPGNEHDGEHEREGVQMSDRAMQALKAMARIAHPFKDEIHQGHVAQVMHSIGIPAEQEADPAADGAEKVHMQRAIPEKVEETHHAEALQMAEKSYKEHLGKLGYRMHADEQPALKSKDKPHEGEEDGVEKTAVSKALDEGGFDAKQKKSLEGIFKSFSDKNEALEKENKTLVQKSAFLEKQLKDGETAQREKELIAKAHSFTHLTLPHDEVVASLRDARAVSPEAYDRQVRHYQTMSDANKTSGVFKELGSQGAGAPGSAEARLDALVDRIVQKSDGSKSREQLYAEVLETPEGSKLYAEAMSSRPGGI